MAGLTHDIHMSDLSKQANVKLTLRIKGLRWWNLKKRLALALFWLGARLVSVKYESIEEKE